MPAHKKPLTTDSPLKDSGASSISPKRPVRPHKRKTAKHSSPPMSVVAEAKPPTPPPAVDNQANQPKPVKRTTTADWSLPPAALSADLEQKGATKEHSVSKTKLAPRPLVRTSYNQTSIRRVIILLAVVAVIGGSVAAWENRSWLFPSVQRALKPPANQLHVTKEVIDQARLAAIPQAHQASTPAEATAAPNLKPQYLDPTETTKPTGELFTDLKAAQTQLADQHINDNGALQHYLDLATAAQNRQDDATARTQLLNGLELAKELQILHDYYKK